jgi:hypothetical protein
MKKVIVLIAMLSANVSFAATTPMNVVEMASHRLATLIKNNKAPKEAGANITAVQVEAGQFGAIANGYRTTLYSESASAGKPNTIEIFLDANAKVITDKVTVTNGLPATPIFTVTDGGKLLDLASEEIVDHLTDDPTLVEVAQLAQSILVTKIATPGQALFQIKLKDGRIYEVVLDLKGQLVRKNFKK